MVFLLSLVPVQLPCCVLATPPGQKESWTPLCKQSSLFPSLSWMVLEFPAPCESCAYFPPLRSLCLCLGLLGSSSFTCVKQPGQVSRGRQNASVHCKMLLASGQPVPDKGEKGVGWLKYITPAGVSWSQENPAPADWLHSFHPLLWVMWVVYFFIAALAENN